MQSQSIEELNATVNERVNFERRQYAPGPETGKELDAEPQKENESFLKFPAHIIKGAAGNFANILSACMEPPLHFFFIAYLTCMGAVIADKVKLKSELWIQSRLFAVILGESADDRKSTAINKTVDFFIDALTTFAVCFGVGSAEGLQRRFQKDTNLLLVYDELKAFVGKAKVDGSVLLPCVCTLFESNRYESHTKDKEIILTSAFLSILAASTIETYERCWDSAFQDIGMTNRLFIVPGQGKRQHAIPGRVPYEQWEVMRSDLRRILNAAYITPELDVTPAAHAIYKEWYLNLEQSVHTKRLDTYALRFMILLAVNSEKSEIDKTIVQNVIDLMNWQLQARRLHDPIDADSTIAKIEEKIRRILKAQPRTEYEIKRAVHYSRIGTWAFSNAIRNLTKSNEIQFDKSTNRWGLK